MIGAPLYALHDSDGEAQKLYGSFRVSRDAASSWNQQGYGIFHVVNPFTGKRRAENGQAIEWWFAEVDGGNKTEQYLKAEQSPLLPSRIVESKNGLHLYWRSEWGTGLDTWYDIVRDRLVPHFGADPKSTDPLRLLRAPGFLHLKKSEDPFEIRVTHDSGATYAAELMLEAFQPVRREVKAKRESVPGGTFWQRVAQLDGVTAIERVSGHPLCNGERFYLRPTSRGTHNIIREHDGYSTGCWVNDDGQLAGVAGGNSIAAWLAWYGHDWPVVAEAIKRLFPEVKE